MACKLGIKVNLNYHEVDGVCLASYMYGFTRRNF